MIQFLQILLNLVAAHPEILPSLSHLVESLSSSKDKLAAARAAQAAAAKAAIRAP